MLCKKFRPTVLSVLLGILQVCRLDNCGLRTFESSSSKLYNVLHRCTIAMYCTNVLHQPMYYCHAIQPMFSLRYRPQFLISFNCHRLSNFSVLTIREPKLHSRTCGIVQYSQSLVVFLQGNFSKLKLFQTSNYTFPLPSICIIFREFFLRGKENSSMENDALYAELDGSKGLTNKWQIQSSDRHMSMGGSV